MPQAHEFVTETHGFPAVVRVYPDLDALSRAAAEQILSVLDEVLPAHDRFSLALPGGRTPRPLFDLLGGPYRDRVPWDRVFLFWGDERYVPADDAASNYREARDALIAQVPIPADHVFPVPTQVAPARRAAEVYETTLHAFFEGRDPAFDVTLLGLGTDGHTASLFPENDPRRLLDLPEDEAPWVQAVTAPERVAPRERITLTLPALNRSRYVFFLVSGSEKQEALRRVVVAGDEALPAAFVRAREEVTWFADAAAWST